MHFPTTAAFATLLFRAARLVALSWVVTAVLLTALQARLVYYPSSDLIATPSDVGLDYQDIWLTTDDGVRLHGWYIPHPYPKACVLFFHGNAGNISHRLDSVTLFHRLGVETLIVDYRGYGQSGGRPSEQGTYQDARAAWRYLLQERGLPAERIVIFGRSLGGAIAVWLAAALADTNTIAGLIVESSFTSIPDVGELLYPFLPVRWLSRIDYNSLERIGTVRTPVLVIHSQDDELVPDEQGRHLYAAAPQPKRFLTLRGNHSSGFLQAGERYADALRDFISGLPQDTD